MDELEIAGQRYLSTRRAAKEHKYTPDYVGQLIRGGKVVGKKVGRSWYVEEASLNAYLSGEGVATVPVIKEKVVEKPIPVPAPVPVQTPALAKVVVEVAEERIEQPVAGKFSEEKTFEPVIIKTKTLDEHHIPIRTIAPIKEKPSAGLRYIVDDEPALPEIKSKSAVTSSPAVAVRKIAAEKADEEYVEIIPNKRVGTFAIAGLIIAGLATLSATAALSATLNSRIVVEQGQVASVSYTFQ